MDDCVTMVRIWAHNDNNRVKSRQAELRQFDQRWYAMNFTCSPCEYLKVSERSRQLMFASLFDDIRSCLYDAHNRIGYGLQRNFERKMRRLSITEIADDRREQQTTCPYSDDDVRLNAPMEQVSVAWGRGFHDLEGY